MVPTRGAIGLLMLLGSGGERAGGDERLAIRGARWTSGRAPFSWTERHRNVAHGDVRRQYVGAGHAGFQRSRRVGDRETMSIGQSALR
jgi:hypothetical protein